MERGEGEIRWREGRARWVEKARKPKKTGSVCVGVCGGEEKSSGGCFVITYQQTPTDVYRRANRRAHRGRRRWRVVVFRAFSGEAKDSVIPPPFFLLLKRAKLYQ
jgi:hypothetical protein